MAKIDARRISKGSQQLLRRQVIAVRQEGPPYAGIQNRYAVQPETARARWCRY